MRASNGMGPAQRADAGEARRFDHAEQADQLPNKASLPRIQELEHPPGTGSDTRLRGLQVILPETCRKCRHSLAVVRDDRLHCSRCCTDRGRLPDEARKFINKIIATFGEPTSPIVLRTNPSPRLQRQTGRRPSFGANGKRK